MTTVTERTIDIEKILKGKMGAKAKFVPGFLVSWLKKIAHQDQVNAFLWESRDKVGVEWLEECVKYLDMTLNIVGKENLPDPNDGKLYTFVSNHPLGGEDGVALGAIIGRFYEGRFRYLVNDLLMNLPGLAPLCIPINKTGNQSRNFPAMVEAGFQSDHHMLNSKFFYRLANFSDKHLPFNLAMLFLVDEMYKNVHKSFEVKIGKPIPWQTFDKSKSPMEWAEFVKDQVYKL